MDTQEPTWATPKLCSLWLLIKAATGVAKSENSPGTAALLNIIQSTFWNDILDAITDPKAATLLESPSPEKPTKPKPCYTEDHPTFYDGRPWTGYGTGPRAEQRHFLIKQALTLAYHQDDHLPEFERGWRTMRQIKQTRGISKTAKANSVVNTLRDQGKLQRRRVPGRSLQCYHYRLFNKHHTDKTRLNDSFCKKNDTTPQGVMSPRTYHDEPDERAQAENNQ